MDKYQEFLINHIDRSYCDLAINGKTNGDDNAFQGKRDKIVLKQNEDITIKDYILYIANRTFESVIAIAGKTQTPFKQEHDPIYSSPKSGDQDRFYLPIDFEHKIDSIKIVFKNNVADDLIISVEYVEADKEAYYAKKEEERKENLLKTADIKVSTGADLVNIYFQPCCDKYEHTEIQLFIPKEEIIKGWTRDGKKIVEIPAWSMIKKSKVDVEEFYKSIGGLADGQYSFVLTQFDKTGKVLLKTDHIEFSIKSGTNAPRRHTVII